MKTLVLISLIAFTGCSLQSNQAVNSGNSTTTSTSTSTSKSVRLTWTAGTGSISGYYVEQSAGTSNVYSVVSTVTTTSTTVTGLSSGTPYQFRVRAFNNGGSSAYTSVVSVTP